MKIKRKGIGPSDVKTRYEYELPDDPHIIWQDSRRFASGMNFYKLFWIFLIGCVLGVAVETVWCALTNHTIESRTGLVLGPFNPVYGFGAVIMTLCLYGQGSQRNEVIFTICFIVGGIFEYICSYFQEFFFGTVSWDYTGMWFSSLNGRTNLMYCVFWGILGLVWLRRLYPDISHAIETIPKKIAVPMTWFFVCFLAFDICISSLAVLRQEARQSGQPAKHAVDVFLDKHFSDAELKEIYPNMIPTGSRSGVSNTIFPQ